MQNVPTEDLYQVVLPITMNVSLAFGSILVMPSGVINNGDTIPLFKQLLTAEVEFIPFLRTFAE